MKRRVALFLFVCLAVLFAVVAVTRPPMPVDETRYLTVAHEMALQHSWLVPSLNFDAYSHKPPVLFWLVRGGWAVFGAHVWVAQLIAVLALGALFTLTFAFARTLARNDTHALCATLLLAGLPAVLTYGGMIRFDGLLALAVTGALYALWHAGQRVDLRAWFLFGAITGTGILIKGPAILLYVLPCAILGPWWYAWAVDRPDTAPALLWRRWYAYMFLSIAVSAAIALLWAVPAALSGGPDYARMIFLGQSAGRMVQAFDHASPFWFYGPALLLFLLPLLAWPRLMRALAAIPARFCDGGIDARALAFLACAALPPVFFFSVIHSKQIHYMLPVMPCLVVMAVMLARPTNLRFAFALAALSFAFVAGAHIAGAKTLFPRYDLAPLGAALAPYKDRAIATAPKYDGEYGFIARLDAPVTSLGRENVGAWLDAHQDGIVILRQAAGGTDADTHVLFRMPFRRAEEIVIIEKAQ